MWSTRVLSDDDITALRCIRSVVADSNHPDKANLIGVLDGVISPSQESTAAVRFTQVFYPGHEPAIGPRDRLAIRLVRTLGSGGESIVTDHNVRDSFARPGRCRVVAYTTTVVVEPTGDGE